MAQTGPIDQLGYMGKYVRTYRPNVLRPHRIANELFGLQSVRAFPSSAVVIQQKKIPDVSFWQGAIDWAKMRQQTDAVIIRAGQRNWVDTKFRDNWQASRDAGMLRGSYWFYDDRESPGNQAEIWAELLHTDPPEMEIYIDWENSYGGSFGGLRNVVACMQAMERFLPTVEIGMYTGYWWFREHSNAVTNAAQYDYLKSRKLFEAWYTLNAANVLIPNPWREIYLWQFGTPAVGAEYGVETAEIDMSFINMTDAEFQQKYRGVVTPPPEAGEPMFGKVLVPLNIRRSPSTSYAPIGQLQVGDIVEASINSSGWWKLTAITRGGQPVSLPGPDCWAYEGATNGYIQPIQPPSSNEYILHVKDGVTRKFILSNE